MSQNMLLMIKFGKVKLPPDTTCQLVSFQVCFANVFFLTTSGLLQAARLLSPNSCL